MSILRSFRMFWFLAMAGACGGAAIEDEAITGPEDESVESIDEALSTSSAEAGCTENPGAPVIRPPGWRAMSWSGENAWAAEGRMFHSAIWTGARMIVFGGDYGKGTPGFEGASYDPATDRWSRIAKSPLARRFNHGAAWTGSELLIWGGNWISSTGRISQSSLGAKFNPSTCSWIQMAPGLVKWRAGSTVIYATSTREFIMFGGALFGASTEFSRYGYAYDVDTDTWRKTARAPIAGRRRHGALWTGDRMLVFGGEVMQDGRVTTSRRAALYDPKTDAWAVPLEGGRPHLDLSYDPVHCRFRQAQERVDGVYASASPNTPAFWFGGYSTDTSAYTGSGAWSETGHWIYFPADTTDSPIRHGMAGWNSSGKFFIWGGAPGCHGDPAVISS